MSFPALDACRAELKQIFDEAGPALNFKLVSSVPDDIKGDVGKVANHVKTLNDRLESLKATGGQVSAALGGRPGGVVPGDVAPTTALGAGYTGAVGVPSLRPTADEAAALHKAVTGQTSARVQLKAAVLSSNTGADQITGELAFRSRMARRIAVAGRIPGESVTGMETQAFPVFGAGAAGLTAEGLAKTEYDAITPGSAVPQMISIWSDTSRQNLLTMTNFERRLSTVHEAKIAQREDLLLISTVTGTTGIQTLVGALTADLVLEGAAKVAAGDVAAPPNLVAVNPTDVPTLLGTTVGAGGTASPPFSEFLPTMHGLIVYPTSHIVAGEALIGAWPAASRFITGLPVTFMVDALSGIKTNTVTLLAEEAVALAVDEPTGFLKITAT